MECIWNVKANIPIDVSEENFKKFICSKIANVIIIKENENCTLAKRT